MIAGVRLTPEKKLLSKRQALLGLRQNLYHNFQMGTIFRYAQ